MSDMPNVILAGAYQQDFERLQREALGPGERITWAGNFTNFRDDDTREFRFGYVVLTPERLLRVSFQAEQSSSCLSCLLILVTLGLAILFLTDKPKRSYHEVRAAVGRAHSHEEIAVAVPTYPLTPSELRSRSVEDVALRYISSIQRVDESIIGSTDHLIEFEIRGPSAKPIWVVLFSEQEAAQLHAALQRRA